MSGRKELIEYRTPNTKHFLKRDGTIEVEIYKDPVHYLDKGEYKEIDNSLVKTTKGFKNKSNDFKIEFDEKDNDSLVNISCKNKKLSMFPKNINQKVSNRSSVKKSKNSLVSNSISYESMYEGVDIDYKVLSNQLKESIILNKIPKENKFVFVINTDLNLILNDDNTISFIDKDKECYKIEKPYMVDKNNIYSESVTYELAKIDNGYEITIIADKEWLNDNERAYPVVIDPTITNAQSSSSVIDTYIFEGDDNATTYNQSMLCVGADKSNRIYRTLLQFELPKIPAGFKVVDAYIRLTCYPDEFGLAYKDVRPLITVHELTDNWNENNAKWSNMHNKYNEHIEDYYVSSRTDALDSEYDSDYINLTHLIQKWYNGDSNYGIMLKAYQEEVQERSRPALYISKDINVQGTNYAKPLLVLTYKNFNGLENYLSYTSQSHFFGSSHISNYTGNLTTIFNVANTLGGVTPISLYLVYNTTDVELNNDYGYGLGIKPNLLQTIESEIIEEETLLKYLDEDGTIHYFYKMVDDDNQDDIYSDEDGLGLTITIEDNKYIMKSKNDVSNIFVKLGGSDKYYLQQIKDLNNNTIDIIYENNKITKILDNKNGEINIIYNDNEIEFISPYVSTTVTLENNLISEIYSLNNTEFITYNSDNLIEKIINPNGTSIKYEYINEKSFKIKKVSEISSKNNEGGSLSFRYSLYDTKILDNKGQLNTYIYNSYGNVIGITNLDSQNNLNNAYGKSYSFEGWGVSQNKLTSDKSLIKYVDNLIEDSSFESGESLRFKSSHMDNTNIASKSYSRSGEYSLEVEIPRGGESVYKEFKVKKGKKYTFSAYIRGMSYSIEDESPLDLFLYYDNSYEVTHISELTDDFVRYSVSIDYDTNATEDLKVVIRNMSAGPNGFYLDDIQLEEGEVANYYNIVDNNDLKNGLLDWTISKDNLVDDFVDVVSISNEVKALRIHSAPQGFVSAEKKFNIKGKKGDVFNFSFWYKNEAILPSGGEGLMPGLWATIFFGYPEDTEYGACVPARYLTIGSDNWQFFSENFIAEDDYEYVELRINSFGGANNCYLTNFSLFKDLECYSYDYDNDGNLSSCVDLNKQTQLFKYDNNKLIETINPMGARYVAEYGDGNRLLRYYTPSGISNIIEYDSNGNPIRTTMINRNVLAALNNDKIYFIRAKGTNKYFYINPDKSVRMKESECSYDKFYIIKHEVVSDIDGQEVTKTYYKFKHAVLNNYYLKVIDNDVKLLFGDNDNIFELMSNDDGSYSILIVNEDEDAVKRAISLTDNFTAIVENLSDNNCQQEFYFEQSENKLYIEANATYTMDGRFLTSVKDTLGNETKYNVNAINGLPNSIIDANNNVTNYSYDDNLRIKKISKGNQKVEYEYDSNNNLSKIIHGTKNYQFEYDEFANISRIKLNDNLLATNIYESNNGNLKTIKYGNGDEVNYIYDENDRVKTIQKTNNIYNCFYDNLGRLTKLRGNEGEYNYLYDFSKRLSYYKNNLYKTEFDYNESNCITRKVEELSNVKKTYNYEYNSIGKLLKLINGSSEFNYEYDILDRIKQKNINNNYFINYDYITNGNKTSIVISKLTCNGIEYSYVYDNVGNLLELSKNGMIVNKYYYDEHYQLIKEDDFVNNNTIEYSYDNYGNILSKKIYTYGTSNLLNEDYYEYNNSNWQDLLTKFNDEVITYDEIGNPITIGSKHLTWTCGRELLEYSEGNNIISYKYDMNGIRISKKVNGVETKYYLENTSIIFEDRNGELIYYLYNGNELLGFSYSDNTYYYRKNIFGDILGILDENCNEIVTYSYDSWGNIININDISNNNIGNINPFRYRSYYYDTETQLYYLNYRYYDPRIGRFINADSFVSTGQGTIGNNMFNYCGNNPVNRIDTGNGWFSDACDNFKSGVDSLKKGVKNTIRKGAEEVKKGVDKVVETYNSAKSAVSNAYNTAKTAVSNFYNDAKENVSNFVTSVKESFVVEWGTGIGAKININDFVDVGGATTFGSTYNNGEWHDYDRFSTGATIGLCESLEAGYSRSYTHYEHEKDNHDYFMDVEALTTHECVEISDTNALTHTKTNATIEGDFVGISISFYFIAGFDFKVGFMVK